MNNKGGSRSGFSTVIKKDVSDVQAYDLRLNDTKDITRIRFQRFATHVGIELTLSELTEFINDLNDIADIMEKSVGNEDNE